MKSLSETHPSLIGKNMLVRDEQYGGCYDTDELPDYVKVYAVQEHTIDKAKLKEAIEKVWQVWKKHEDITPKSDMYGALCFRNDLLKELGLE